MFIGQLGYTPEQVGDLTTKQAYLALIAMRLDKDPDAAEELKNAYPGIKAAEKRVNKKWLDKLLSKFPTYKGQPPDET